ncbi:endosialidase [Anaerolentibacter hominis]|uniref:endosialidase n=1 Tax=Anaerolentibacter hominis TaxID=3079009 RepID=UPI0031B82BBD
MSVIKDLICKTGDTISFGDYLLDEKSKRSDFEHDGDLYKIKTFKEITKLERNGMFVYESVPGTAVHEFVLTENGMEFQVEGADDTQITLGLEPDQEYTVYEDGVNRGKMKTVYGGKLVLSVELGADKLVSIEVIK